MGRQSYPWARECCHTESIRRTDQLPSRRSKRVVAGRNSACRREGDRDARASQLPIVRTHDRRRRRRVRRVRFCGPSRRRGGHVARRGGRPRRRRGDRHSRRRRGRPEWAGGLGAAGAQPAGPHHGPAAGHAAALADLGRRARGALVRPVSPPARAGGRSGGRRGRRRLVASPAAGLVRRLVAEPVTALARPSDVSRFGRASRGAVARTAARAEWRADGAGAHRSHRVRSGPRLRLSQGLRDLRRGTARRAAAPRRGTSGACGGRRHRRALVVAGLVAGRRPITGPAGKAQAPAGAENRRGSGHHGAPFRRSHRLYRLCLALVGPTGVGGQREHGLCGDVADRPAPAR